MNELILEVKKKLPEITGNFEQVENTLQANLLKYKSLVVTADTLKDCKGTQADLNKLKDQIDTYRKDVKKEVSKPITEFENKCKKLVGMIEDVQTPIKEGIATFTLQEREEKRAKVQAIIDKLVEESGLQKEYAERLSIVEKYLNASTTITSIKEEINGIITQLMQEQKQKVLQAITEAGRRQLETESKAIHSYLKEEVPAPYLIPEPIINTPNNVDFMEFWKEEEDKIINLVQYTAIYKVTADEEAHRQLCLHLGMNNYKYRACLEGEEL